MATFIQYYLVVKLQSGYTQTYTRLDKRERDQLVALVQTTGKINGYRATIHRIGELELQHPSRY